MPGWLSRLSVQLLVLDQVVISRVMSSSPASGSVLTVWSPLGILSLPLSLPRPCLGSLSLSFKINVFLIIKNKRMIDPDDQGRNCCCHTMEGGVPRTHQDCQAQWSPSLKKLKTPSTGRLTKDLDLLGKKVTSLGKDPWRQTNKQTAHAMDHRRNKL